MKRLMLAAFVGALALPGCSVRVESRTHRDNPPPPPSYQPPPPPPSATVSVAWTDARTVILREYYEADWDTVGTFEYYETNHGIPEDDLFFLLHVARTSGANFHEVVFTYSNRGRVLFDVCRHYRINTWDLYVDLPIGTICPPAYTRAYGFYWRRDNRVVLTNYDCHALFWLRFSVNYYGWQPREVFTRWDNCVDQRVRYVTVVHRDYGRAGHGNRNWGARAVVKVVERPERDRTAFVEVRRKHVDVRKVQVEVEKRSAQGHSFARPPSRQEVDKRKEEHRHREEEERRREHEERQRAPRNYGKDDKDDKDDKRDDRKDDRKDDRNDDRKDDRRDDRKAPPPPPPKRNPPPPPKKDDKKDDRKDDRNDDRRDDRKDDRGDDRKDDRKDPPPPPKRNPPPPPKKDDKKDDRKDDKKDDSKDDRKDDRKDPPPPPKRNPPPPPPKDDKKDDKKDDRKDDKKDDKKNDRKNDKKDDKKDDGRRGR